MTGGWRASSDRAHATRRGRLLQGLDVRQRQLDIGGLLWGRDDRMVPVHLAEMAAARLGWPLHVIDGAAHAPHIEQPEPFVAALLSAIHAPTSPDRSST